MKGCIAVGTVFGKYDESISLNYKQAVRILMHLKNIRDNFNKTEDPDEFR